MYSCHKEVASQVPKVHSWKLSIIGHADINCRIPLNRFTFGSFLFNRLRCTKRKECVATSTVAGNVPKQVERDAESCSPAFPVRTT